MHIIRHDAFSNGDARFVADTTGIVASHVDEVEFIFGLEMVVFGRKYLLCLRNLSAWVEGEERKDIQPTGRPLLRGTFTFTGPLS
jgi:hypothetical protein